MSLLLRNLNIQITKYGKLCNFLGLALSFTQFQEYSSCHSEITMEGGLDDIVHHASHISAPPL